MIDVELIKRSTDCRRIVEHDLGKPKNRTQEYSTFKCPFHQERKGYSLVVYATHWRCFGKCGVGGDVIGWLMRYHQLSFQQACERLAAGDLPHTAERLLHPEPEPESRSEPPDEKWQKVARRIADQAADRLWRSEGRRALDYLKTKRGLSEGIIAAAQLGYIPGKPQEWNVIEGLKVPCGIAHPLVRRWCALGHQSPAVGRRAALPAGERREYPRAVSI